MSQLGLGTRFRSHLGTFLVHFPFGSSLIIYPIGYFSSLSPFWATFTSITRLGNRSSLFFPVGQFFVSLSQLGTFLFTFPSWEFTSFSKEVPHSYQTFNLCNTWSHGLKGIRVKGIPLIDLLKVLRRPLQLRLSS